MLGTKEFNWDEKTKTLSAELSDLKKPGRYRGNVVFETVAQPNSIQGIYLQSHKTGAITTYQIIEEQRDGENDIQAWVLIPTGETLAKVPGTRGTKVLIFND